MDEYGTGDDVGDLGEDEGAGSDGERLRVGQRIRRLREERGWSPTTLHRRADVSRQTLYAIEGGEATNVRRGTLDRIAKALGWQDAEAMMTTDALEPVALGSADADELSPDEERLRQVAREEAEEALRRAGVRPVEVRPDDEFVFLKIAADVSAGGAGGGRRLVDTGEVVAVWKGDLQGKDAIVVRVRGECMVPVLYDGDLVICEKVRDSSEVPSGALAVVTLLDDDVDDGGNVKYVDWASRMVRLRAEAPGYKPIVVPRDRIKVEGRVFESRRRHAW